MILEEKHSIVTYFLVLFSTFHVSSWGLVGTWKLIIFVEVVFIEDQD
jgi:hypothetical protein